MTVNNLSQTGHAVKVLKENTELIPLVLNAIDIEQEDLIQTIFETLTDFLERPKVLKPHLQLLIEASVNISVKADLAFNVRSTTLYFLEQLGDTFSRQLVKKGEVATLKKIIECGCQVACEDVSEYPSEEENPHELALIMLYQYAAEMPNEVAYPIFKDSIVQLCSSQEPLQRKAGLKILGQVCDSDSLLDCIKEEVELYTEILIKLLQDGAQIVREAACLAIGDFSEHVIPDFLEQHATVMPVLLQVLEAQLEIATQSEEQASNAERAIYALSEFCANMEEYEIRPYLSKSLEVCVAYLNGAQQHRKVKYMALTALSSIIIAADNYIIPSRDVLMNSFMAIVQGATALQDQAIKGKALMCAGNLAQACGRDNFPQAVLEDFTRFGIQCLQHEEAIFELKETAINYFSEISKIMKSDMAPLIPTIIEPILAVASADLAMKTAPKAAKEFSLDSDSDDEDVVGIDLEGVDEKTSAIHAIGNIYLNCSALLEPYLERIVKVLKDLDGYCHENVRYHVCLSYTQIAFGLLRCHSGRPDSDDKIDWTPGMPTAQQLPPQVVTFLDQVLMPHFKELFESEFNKEVIEKVLECIRDLADEMGPCSLATHLDVIIEFVEILLDKQAFCQTRNLKVDDPEGQGDEDDDDEEDEEDGEDMDHDEIILGNATDVLVSLAKCFQDSFLPSLQKLGPKLVKYLGDEHGKSDRIMVIGCLCEVFNQCPTAITAYFDNFMQVLLKHSVTDDGSLNRNVSYGIAVFADKAPVELFGPHLQTALSAIKQMHTASAEADAKDNCIACIVRILEKYHDKLPAGEYDTLFGQIMSAIPLDGDPGENQTILKFVMNVNATQPERVLPHMDKITLTCLKLLTDSRCKKDVEEPFKVLTAKFIKNVIMQCGREDVVANLQAMEAQMSEFERADLAKCMEKAQ